MNFIKNTMIIIFLLLVTLICVGNKRTLGTSVNKNNPEVYKYKNKMENIKYKGFMWLPHLANDEGVWYFSFAGFMPNDDDKILMVFQLDLRYQKGKFLTAPLIFDLNTKKSNVLEYCEDDEPFALNPIDFIEPDQIVFYKVINHLNRNKTLKKVIYKGENKIKEQIEPDVGMRFKGSADGNILFQTLNLRSRTRKGREIEKDKKTGKIILKKTQSKGEKNEETKGQEVLLDFGRNFSFVPQNKNIVMFDFYMEDIKYTGFYDIDKKNKIKIIKNNNLAIKFIGLPFEAGNLPVETKNKLLLDENIANINISHIIAINKNATKVIFLTENDHAGLIILKEPIY